MKRLTLAFVLFSLFALIYLVWRAFIFDKNGKTLEKSLAVSPQSLGEPTRYSKTYDFEFDQIYKVNLYEIESIDNLFLKINLPEKQPASKIFSNENCSFLVNAGFYTKEGDPVGLFISEGKKIRDFSKNQLFDGVFSVNSMATPRITIEQPKDSLRVALQSGPILIENARPQKLSLKNDKPARRVVLAITGENKIIFLIFYKKDSAYLGPLLNSLPEMLQKFQEENGLNIADAINLDGGTASAFYTKEVSVVEASPVGSYFCYKENP